MRISTLLVSLFVVFVLVGCDRAEEPPPQTAAPKSPAAPEAKPETAAKAPEKVPTASDQPGTEADVKIVQEIRQSVEKDESLSTQAQNVTIVSKEGKVTLRGTVKDEAEKKLLAARAQQVDGVRGVDNQLVIAR